MTIIQFDFFDNNEKIEQIDVELHNTRGAQAWAYAVLLNNPSRKVQSPWLPPEQPARQQQLLLNIHNTIDELNALGYIYPSAFPTDYTKLNYSHFNLLHRFFTNSEVSLWDNKTKPLDNILAASAPLSKLNTLIHNLELYYPTTKRIDYIKKAKEMIISTDCNEIGYDIKPFRNHHTFEHCDVVIDWYILGKTLLESFVSNDDPSEWDTSGNIRTTGGCAFLLTDYRYQTYHSQDFQNWLTEHNCGYQNTHADFPLGNFLPNQKSKAESIYSSRQLSSISCNVSVII